jgi:hypothetical protein
MVCADGRGAGELGAEFASVPLQHRFGRSAQGVAVMRQDWAIVAVVWAEVFLLAALLVALLGRA